ncbi:MAG TPA: DUF1109 domain-containing protein [Sphingomicrobium sp.]|nr:DUF1109 domain-containing protein [Sphingomicrobium sp.]
MRTDQLIAQLASGPAVRTRPVLRIALAIGVGWLVALVGLAMVEGAPMAAVEHTGAAAFAVKLGYTLALASLAALAAIAAGRPGRRLSGPVMLIAIPLLLVLGIASIELATSDPTRWSGMMRGATYWSCFTSVVVASLPVFVGMVWAYRTLAPTRLALAGFLIGLSAGAAGALAFALYCHETTAAFLLTAYTPAMLVTALLGMAVARPLLRW